MEDTCIHCGDQIVKNDRGAWVDENALRSCAPFAHRHEPSKDYVFVHSTGYDDNPPKNYAVNREFFEKDIQPLLDLAREM